MCRAGIWSADDSTPLMAGHAGGSESQDVLHRQIGIAIGYGYVEGELEVGTDRVIYRKLALTSKGSAFLATMDTLLVSRETTPTSFRSKVIAAVAGVAGLLLLTLLVWSFVTPL